MEQEKPVTGALFRFDVWDETSSIWGKLDPGHRYHFRAKTQDQLFEKIMKRLGDRDLSDIVFVSISWLEYYSDIYARGVRHGKLCSPVPEKIDYMCGQVWGCSWLCHHCQSIHLGPQFFVQAGLVVCGLCNHYFGDPFEKNRQVNPYV